MKKLFIFLAAVIMTASVMANDSISSNPSEKPSSVTSQNTEANKVIGVAGVMFGDSKRSVSRALYPRCERIESEKDLLNIYKLKVGGFMYEFCMFHFDGKNGLVSVMLQKPFRLSEKEEALITLGNIKWQYQQKYSNMRLDVDTDEAKIYSCGASEPDYPYPPITISFHKSLSDQGKMWYYVQVIYYLYKGNNHNTDDI